MFLFLMCATIFSSDVAPVNVVNVPVYLYLTGSSTLGCLGIFSSMTRSCIAFHFLIRYQHLSYLILPYLTLSYLILPYLTLSYLILPYLTLSYLILPYLTAYCVLSASDFIYSLQCKTRQFVFFCIAGGVDLSVDVGILFPVVR